MWKCNNGFFDDSGPQIDHIIEVKHGGTNDLNNLQVLCCCCHAVKTKRCAKQGWDYNSPQLDDGCARMEVDRIQPGTKRKRTSQ
jgi:5-methylcytosine-specific restriction endonuclease McrA